ncbi:MAG: ribose-phosphate pyrophosphokinase [Caldiserica bacterium CG02_land_8_20_14_3_00_36_38]|nr:ribose-phosphate pyrophosphokinase [Caldisericota bacterium]NCQ52891.1 ribose-phosphate pyrophosphokinase [Caldisericota bacterium]OIP13049.1 MAG: ribose-phosphate pyrophosphokinase [Caldisericum sp. CG2_30_36_11]PIV56928.1 MAG: ribose-phosphate pyrophosphokinase [Caldiserica bacterium CG02_land_8_20_14_3_00_36_38]
MISEKFEDFKIFTGNSNIFLAKSIVGYLGMNLGEILSTRFPDGEIYVRCLESVRGKEVFVIQSTYSPSDNLMELLIMIDALKRASARSICAVIPFFGYARQDRKTKSREPISAKLVANLITVAGATRVISVDLHAGQIQGFFDIPLDNLTAVLLLRSYFKDKELKNPVIVAPDVGAVPRTTEFSKGIRNSTQAIFVKKRLGPDEVETSRLIGEVKDKTVILVDDAIHTGGTMINAAEEVLKRGAIEVYVGATHGVFALDSLEKLEKSAIKEIVVTDTMPVSQRTNLPSKVKVLSVASLIGEAIKRIVFHESVSELFEKSS